VWANLTGKRKSRHWIQGVVVSVHGETSMCEVLYTNGWVVWHRQASFEQKDARQLPAATRRTRNSSAVRNLQAFDSLEDMLAFAHFERSGGYIPEGESFLHWVQGAEIFGTYLSCRQHAEAASMPGSRRTLANRQVIRARAEKLVKDLRETYRGLS
jgi:hypothetical protein